MQLPYVDIPIDFQKNILFFYKTEKIYLFIEIEKHNKFGLKTEENSSRFTGFYIYLSL